MAEVVLDGCSLRPRALVAIGAGASVSLCPEARARMAASAEWLADGPHADVIHTKWSWLSGRSAPAEGSDTVRVFLEDHCAGVGEPLAPAGVRSLMASRSAGTVAVTGARILPAVRRTAGAEAETRATEAAGAGRASRSTGRTTRPCRRMAAWRPTPARACGSS